VIGGGKDKLFSTKEFQRTSRIHDAGMIIIPHMGHDMMLDHGHAWLVDLNPIPEMNGIFLYGCTSIAVLMAFAGLFFVFE
jgi:pimeloyl-ACP methyl ester carboxylesterase